MILVDFDWGGKDGEAEFPHEELIEDLGVSNDRLYGRIENHEGARSEMP